MRNSVISQRSDQSGAEEFLIPVAFDPTPPVVQSSAVSNQKTTAPISGRPRDYFGSTAPAPPHQKPLADSQTSQASSPHIAYQEKGKQPSGEVIDSIRRRREGSGSGPGSGAVSPHTGSDKTRRQFAESPKTAQNSREGAAQVDRFKLQEVPKTKRSGGSTRSSRSEVTSPPLESSAGAVHDGDRHGTEHSREKSLLSSPFIKEPDSLLTKSGAVPSPSLDYEPEDNEEVDQASVRQQSGPGHLQFLPKRGDSLESSKLSQTIPRKEISTPASKSQTMVGPGGEDSATRPSKVTETVTDSAKVHGGKAISKPIESPLSKSLFDAPNALQGRSEGIPGERSKESFVATRAPPLPPYDPARSRNESISTLQSEAPRLPEQPISPTLPRYSAGGEFTMDEDMARILGTEDPSNHESFLRRVSNSVRHGRSYSDNRARLSKEHRWPRSPTAANTLAGQDISSPSSASPEHRDELTWFKNELRRERQKTVEREQKIVELEATLESTANIKQVNTELREKRSTMVVLDTQKEIVVRELEVLTEHIAAAKRSGDPLDLGKMRSAVLRDFAEALQRLKDSFAPQIEESIQKRNDLVDEISSLTQMKDKSFQEFEQLSLKNAQLAELNNLLVHQIQGLYKANSGPNAETPRGAPNGLGIYSHQKDKSQISIDSRELRSNGMETSIPGSGSTLQQNEAEPVTVLQGPHVVNIRKGQAKKFNWKKGGHNVAKGVTKGLKGAFSSTQQNYNRELQFAEGTPYGSMPPGQEYADIPRTGNEPIRQGYGFFANQKAGPKGNGQWKTQPNGSSSALALDASTCKDHTPAIALSCLQASGLYGSDLEQRAEFEKVDIPVIVTRCIQEVELRGELRDHKLERVADFFPVGMDVEGIYRKSGGTSQIQTIKEGFERSPNDFDLSDPDLDIHAVTSGLKQYFRRLPSPLITYEVYDTLLDTTNVSAQEQRIEAMHRALMDLPKVHRDVLEFLTFHLKRVVERESENLMTSMNIAVVFAPTIMRPESLSRELTDTGRKNEAVQFLVENCQEIFMGSH